MLRSAPTGPEASSTTAQPAVLTIPRPPPRSSVGLVLGIVGGLLALLAIVIVGGVMLVSRALPAYSGRGTPPPAEPGDNGVLTNVNEATLRTRIERHGLKVGVVSRNDYGTGCSWTQLEVVTPTSGGYHVFLYDYASRALAANQLGILRKGPGGWLTAEGTRILWCGLADAPSSRKLCEALVDPPLGGGRR